MPLNLDDEFAYYRQLEARAVQINDALQREDVRQALKRCPDIDSLSASVTSHGVVISAIASLERDPVIADIATGCDGQVYVLSARQALLQVPGMVTVEVYVTGRWPLAEDDREVLRAIGKLQTETSTREYLACAI